METIAVELRTKRKSMSKKCNFSLISRCQSNFFRMVRLSYLYKFARIPWHTSHDSFKGNNVHCRIFRHFLGFSYKAKLFIFLALKLQKNISVVACKLQNILDQIVEMNKLQLDMGRNLQNTVKTTVIGVAEGEKSPRESYRNSASNVNFISK